MTDHPGDRHEPKVLHEWTITFAVGGDRIARAMLNEYGERWFQWADPWEPKDVLDDCLVDEVARLAALTQQQAARIAELERQIAEIKDRTLARRLEFEVKIGEQAARIAELERALMNVLLVAEGLPDSYKEACMTHTEGDRPANMGAERGPSNEAIHAAESLLARLSGLGPAIVYQGDDCQYAGQSNLVAQFARHFQAVLDAGRECECGLHNWRERYAEPPPYCEDCGGRIVVAAQDRG